MKKFFKILFFILLGIGVIWTFVYLYKKSRPQEVVYEIEEAKIDTIQKTTVVTGQIDPRDEVAMKPQVSGIISGLLAGVLPAWRAIQIKAIDAIREE